MDKRGFLYGTPLSRSLDGEQQDEDGSFHKTRARLNRQQTVRDDQGRQRFHGAFTGGFSAGYFNTVDTVAGFRPRQFVTHRADKQNDAVSSRFSHKPEDYMDEEDFGEFGIAPKRLQLSGQLSGKGSSVSSAFQDKLLLSSTTIGEKILRRLDRELGLTRTESISREIEPKSVNFTAKNDFHGLGYRPLESNFISDPGTQRSTNPLTAILERGKRLKISGEAFGTGVLEDDDSYNNVDDTYGYDNIRNYCFKGNHRSVPKHSSEGSNTRQSTSNFLDDAPLPGFVLVEDLSQCDSTLKKFPLPAVPKDWIAPVRVEPIPPKPSESAQSLTFNRSRNVFDKKFVSGAATLNSSPISDKAGLVLYSELKCVEPNPTRAPILSEDESLLIAATISRQQFEWRPCSLLCKRFNVPNPFPDNSFVGVQPSELNEASRLESACIDGSETCAIRQDQELIELRRSIFNISFTQHPLTDRDLSCDSDGNSEDEPQVLDEIDFSHVGQETKSIHEDEPEVIVVPASRREPELIVLSDSSSESSLPSPSTVTPNVIHPNEHDCDMYGPPLPPTLKTLIDLDQRQSASCNRSTQKQRKKNKKHKKHRHLS